PGLYLHLPHGDLHGHADGPRRTSLTHVSAAGWRGGRGRTTAPRLVSTILGVDSMSKVSTYVSAVLCLLVFVAFASAQAAVPTNVTLAGRGVGAAMGIALSIVGAGWGFGRIGAAALESMARQPDKAGEIQTAMIIIAALLEGATLLALILCVVIGTSGG